MISAAHETLADLLDRYGCSENEDGWRRLAILLAIEAKKIERSKYVPAVRIEHQFQALIEEAVLNGGVKSRVTASEMNELAQHRLGNTKYVAGSLRSMASTSRGQAQEAQAAGRWSDDELRSVGASRGEGLSAAQVAHLAPDQVMGQAKLDSELLTSLERTARQLTHDASGTYMVSRPVPVDEKREIIGVCVRRSSQRQPRGAPPLEGRHLAAVKLIIREDLGGGRFQDDLILPDHCSHLIERLDCRGTNLECSTGELMSSPTDRCLHPRECVEFRGKVAWKNYNKKNNENNDKKNFSTLDILIHLDGVIFDEMGSHPCLDAVFTITPPRDRRHVASYAAIPRTAL